MAQIRFEGLSLESEGRIVAKDINFEANAGDFICVTGERAARMEFVRVLMGINRPAEGRIVFGNGLTRELMGFLPKETATYRSYPMSVFEVVLSGCLNNGKGRLFFKKADKERAEHALEYVGIPELKKRKYHELSGGQQQKVLFARALCATDMFLCLDEPFTGLDAGACEELRQIMHRANSEEKLTILSVTETPEKFFWSDEEDARNAGEFKVIKLDKSSF